MVFVRFQDGWVVDRVMFEYVNQGGCSCCGFAHKGMELQEFMALCSDVNTDDANKEKLSPWPKFMHDEIWADRVKFRRKLKKKQALYKERFSFSSSLLLSEKDFSEISYQMPLSGPDEFFQWWTTIADDKTKRRCFILPKSDFFDIIRNTFDFSTAYNTLLCSVEEQLENFKETGYTNDAESDFEQFFLDSLGFMRKAFVVRKQLYQSKEGNKCLLNFLKHLTSSSNLPKRAKDEKNIIKTDIEAENESKGNEDIGVGNDEEQEEQTETQTFRGDRRLLRLVIFRFYADQMYNQFKRYKEELNKSDAEDIEKKSMECDSQTINNTEKVSCENGTDSETKKCEEKGLCCELEEKLNVQQ